VPGSFKTGEKPTHSQGGILMFQLLNHRIFTLSTLVMIGTLSTALLAFSAASEAGPTAFSLQAYGNFEASAFVFPDGNGSDSITLPGTSSLGPVAVHAWAAGTGTPVKCTLPGGVADAGNEGRFTDLLETIRFASGDFLIQTLVSGTECADFSAGVPPFPFAGHLILRNDGGTGAFVGATGTVTEDFDGAYLSCGPNGCVGYVHHHETGHLITP
jgi:hypothetical protein